MSKDEDRKLWALGAEQTLKQFELSCKSPEERIKLAQEWLKEHWTDDDGQQYEMKFAEEDDPWAQGCLDTLEKIANNR